MTEEAAGVEGRQLIAASWWVTMGFAVVAVAGVIAPDTFGVAVAVVSLLLFALGCVIFLQAFWLAVQRSRRELIGIGGLYFLAGSAPAPVRRSLLGAFGLQVAVSFGAALARPFTSVAFVVLVPLLGLALCGLWGARYGTFPPRA